MEYSSIISEALITLTVNKLRSGLAILGIIIGIGSVIALISLGQSSQKSIENQIQSLGAAGSGTTLTLDDAKAIQTSLQITTVKNVSPEYSRRAQVTAGRNNTNTQVIGVYPAYLDIRKLAVSNGSFITNRDISSMTKVAVIGPQAASDLFGEGVNPVGSSIRINGQSLKIIGQTESKGGTGFNNPDDTIYVPLPTAQKQLFGSTSLSSIVVEAQNQDVMTEAQNQIGYFLLARHKLTDPGQADFIILSQNDILNTAAQVTGVFTTLLGGIAAISLLVGGIGIMNIMLVTVTERTREIGLRKALGAKKKTIITQFLTEAIILTITGGFIGMLIGIAISFILSSALSLPFTVSFTAVLLAVSVSGAIGIIFGWYPARKASNLQPIEALRYE